MHDAENKYMFIQNDKRLYSLSIFVNLNEQTFRNLTWTCLWLTYPMLDVGASMRTPLLSRQEGGQAKVKG